MYYYILKSTAQCFEMCFYMWQGYHVLPQVVCVLRVRPFGRIRKQICDTRSHGFFTSENEKTQNGVVCYDKTEWRHAKMVFGSYQNDISQVLS